MKILFFIDSLERGGKEGQLLLLLRELLKNKDFDCQLALMSDVIEYPQLETSGDNIHVLERKGRKDPRIFSRLQRICKNFEPDIIHAWDPMTSFYALPIARFMGIKIVNGSIRNSRPSRLMTKTWLINRIVFPFSNVIVANSNAGLASHRLKMSKKNVVIYNGFDFRRLEVIRPQERVQEELYISAKYVVGMVASFVKKKDFKTFILSAKEILKKRSDIVFLCVGDGPMFEQMKALAGEKLNAGIQFCGKRLDVESFVNIFDIGVLLYVQRWHSEGISNAILEYMALRKPVIANKGGGNEEVVLDRKTGFLIRSGDRGDLVSKIEQLLEDQDLAERMGQAGVQRVREFFSLDKMVSAYVDLYRRLIPGA